MASPVKPIIFLHIPKTAGTTVQHIMHNVYRGETFFTTGNYKQIELFQKFSDEEKLKISVLKGHINFGVHKMYPAPIQYFTFFRDPIKRTISAFNHIYKDKGHVFNEEIIKKQYTLKQMLQEGYVKNFDNCHVRFIAGAIDVEYGKINQEIYEQAVYNFDKYFNAFGISDRFNESIIYIKRQLDWPLPFYVNANESDRIKATVNFDSETYDLINHYNKYDLQLYNYALNKFNGIVNSLGSEFQAEVNRFDKLNKLQSPIRKLARNIYKKLKG